jgi:uncharacterized protein (DUF983 family)
MSFMESNKTCPGCGRPHAFEWNVRTNTGWCLVCGYYEYFIDYDDFKSSQSDEDNSVHGC